MPDSSAVLSYDPAIFQCPGQLVVHAVFPHAWQLRSPTGGILSVVDGPWNGPHTVRVTSLPALRHVSPGMVARLSGSDLAVGPVILSFAAARPWMASRRGFDAVLTPALLVDLPAAEAKLRCAADGGLAQMAPWERGAGLELSSRAIPSARSAGAVSRSSLPAWAHRGSFELSALQSALIAERANAVTRHAVGLLGLGPGLTPAGDDALCGLCAGLSILGARSARHSARYRRAAAALEPVIETEAPHRTTALSATLLRSAGRGVVVEPLFEFLATVGSGTPVRGIDEVLMLGHSSGSDMLTGALMACRAFAQWEEVFGPAMVGSR